MDKLLIRELFHYQISEGSVACAAHGSEQLGPVFRLGPTKESVETFEGYTSRRDKLAHTPILCVRRSNPFREECMETMAGNTRFVFSTNTSQNYH